MIACADISFSYGAKPLIRSLSLDLADRNLVAVIGPNGSGKTTLLKIICGLLKPDTGSIRFAGEPPPIPVRQLMWLPARIDMPFSYSVRDVLQMLLYPWDRLRHYERKEDAVRAALAEVDLSATLDRSFNSLSAGEQHRATLGAALVSDAKVLVLDEPCSNLDVGAAHRIMKKLKIAAEAGKVILFSIHDLQLAYQHCESFILLTPEQGAVCGTRSEIFTSSALENAFDIRTKLVLIGDLDGHEGQTIPIFRDL